MPPVSRAQRNLDASECVHSFVVWQPYLARLAGQIHLENMLNTPPPPPPANVLLLDHCMVVYGSSLSDGNRHNHEDLPVIILGRGNGKLKSGRHIVYDDKPPMTNLFLTLLDKLGVPTEKLGDGSGRVAHLSDV
jgi:hypothetical protein